MDINENMFVVTTILDNDEHQPLKCINDRSLGQNNSSLYECQTNEDSEFQSQESKQNDISEKHNAIWTTNSTETLLKLYEAKLEMLETPKKKTRIWIAISESLKEQGIEMTPDQVRWKINALAKKYKQCIDNGHHKRFRYFKEMDSIYSRFNVDCDSYAIADILYKRKSNSNHSTRKNGLIKRSGKESKAMIEVRKLRLANRMDYDRKQTKLNIERQWLEYLKRQEQYRLIKEDLFDRSLKLREEELEIKKKELELKESLECQKLELAERDVDEMINIEKEKCELLRQLLCSSY